MEAEDVATERKTSKLVYYADYRSRADAIFGALGIPAAPQGVPVPPEAAASGWSVRDQIPAFQRGSDRPGLGPAPPSAPAGDSDAGSSSEDDDERADPMTAGFDARAAESDSDEDGAGGEPVGYLDGGGDDEEGEGFGRGARRRSNLSRPMSKRYSRAVDYEDEEDEFDRLAEARDPETRLDRSGVYRGGAARPETATEVPQDNVYERRCRDHEGLALADVDAAVQSSGLDPSGPLDWTTQFSLRSGLAVDLGPGEGAALPWRNGRGDLEGREYGGMPQPPPPHQEGRKTRPPLSAQPSKSALKAAPPRGGLEEEEGTMDDGGSAAIPPPPPLVQRQRSVRFSADTAAGVDQDQDQGRGGDRRGQGSSGARPPGRSGGGGRGGRGSRVPEHVRNPERFTVYTFDEEIVVGGGYTALGVKNSHQHHAGDDREDLRRALRATQSAALAAARPAQPEASDADLPGLEPAVPIEPGAPLSLFRPKHARSGAVEEAGSGEGHQASQGGAGAAAKVQRTASRDGKIPGGVAFGFAGGDSEDEDMEEEDRAPLVGGPFSGVGGQATGGVEIGQSREGRGAGGFRVRKAK